MTRTPGNYGNLSRRIGVALERDCHANGVDWAFPTLREDFPWVI
jgi:hypothetical protein